MVGIPLSHLPTMPAFETQVAFETLLPLVRDCPAHCVSSFCRQLLGTWSLLLLHMARHERAVRAMKSQILMLQAIYVSINLRNLSKKIVVHNWILWEIH